MQTFQILLRRYLYSSSQICKCPSKSIEKCFKSIWQKLRVTINSCRWVPFVYLKFHVEKLKNKDSGVHELRAELKVLQREKDKMADEKLEMAIECSKLKTVIERLNMQVSQSTA